MASTIYYLGSPAGLRDVIFAHGGSVIFLSQATMYDMAVTHKGVESSWDKPTHEVCCDDYVIGAVLKKSGIVLKPSWPTVNGEKMTTLPFGPTHWCQPVVSMHHVQPNEMNQIATFERSRNNTRVSPSCVSWPSWRDGELTKLYEPLTFAELYNEFVKDILSNTLEQWANECLDAQREA